MTSKAFDEIMANDLAFHNLPSNLGVDAMKISELARVAKFTVPSIRAHMTLGTLDPRAGRTLRASLAPRKAQQSFKFALVQY